MEQLSVSFSVLVGKAEKLKDAIRDAEDRSPRLSKCRSEAIAGLFRTTIEALELPQDVTQALLTLMCSTLRDAEGEHDSVIACNRSLTARARPRFTPATGQRSSPSVELDASPSTQLPALSVVRRNTP